MDVHAQLAVDLPSNGWASVNACRGNVKRGRRVARTMVPLALLRPGWTRHDVSGLLFSPCAPWYVSGETCAWLGQAPSKRYSAAHKFLQIAHCKGKQSRGQSP